jgi:glycosyltransferase involved in cell wall biosynthesis
VGGRDSEKLKADLTTEDTESTEGLAGLFLGKPSGGAFSNPSPSELARDSETTSRISSADGPAGARIAPGGMGSVGGNQLADSGEFLEGQSQAGSHMDSQKLQSIRAANDHSASGEMSIPNESAKISENRRKNPSAPATSAAPEVVFLAFGFIRNNKNLDLVIRALADNAEAVLVVMGRVQSKRDKPLDFYRDLAKKIGVEGRVKFFDGFVPDEKLASYFAAADVVVLTYDGTFRSQSGVLNVAARAKRLVLASAGESPLKDSVLRFRLGVFVEPDDLVRLKDGMAKLIDAKCEMRNVVGGEAGPDWEGYGNFASWDVNVSKILDALRKVRMKKWCEGQYAPHAAGQKG